MTDPLGSYAPPECVSLLTLAARVRVPVRRLVRAWRERKLDLWEVDGLYRVRPEDIPLVVRHHLPVSEQEATDRRALLLAQAEAAGGLPPRSGPRRRKRGSSASS